MRTQYKNLQEIKNELLNNFLDEHEQDINDMANLEDYKNLKQKYINIWVDNTFIYDEDIINLLSNNIVDLQDLDNLKNEFPTTRIAILFALIEKLEQDIIKINLI